MDTLPEHSSNSTESQLTKVKTPVLQAYYPSHRGSSGTGPTVVDREQYTIIADNNGFYSGRGMALTIS